MSDSHDKVIPADDWGFDGIEAPPRARRTAAGRRAGGAAAGAPGGVSADDHGPTAGAAAVDAVAVGAADVSLPGVTDGPARPGSAARRRSSASARGMAGALWERALAIPHRAAIVTVLFFAGWSLLLAFPYFGFGSMSFVVLHDTAEMNLPRAIWYGSPAAETGLGSWSPQGVSGTDRLASGLSTDLDTLLFMVLPGWLAYGLFMWLQRFIAGYFLYRLLREWKNVTPLAAAAVSCAYALFTQPHINMGWTGFALYDGLALPGLPLVLYVLFRSARWRARYRYPVAVVTGLLFALSSHFFLALFGVLAVCLIALVGFPCRDKRAFWVAPLLFAGAWLLGELPVLLAAAANAGLSHRGDRALLNVNIQGGVVYRQWLPKFLGDNALALALTAAALVLAVLRRSWRLVAVVGIAALCVLLVTGAPFLRDSVFAHLGPLSGFRFDRLFVVLPFLTLLAGGLGLGLLPRLSPAFTVGAGGLPRRAGATAAEARAEVDVSTGHGGSTGSGGGSADGGPSCDGAPTRTGADLWRDGLRWLDGLVRRGGSSGGGGGSGHGGPPGDCDPPGDGGPRGGGGPFGDAGPSRRGGPPGRRYRVPVQALVGLVILLAVLVQAIAVQARVAGEMEKGAIYESLYGSPQIEQLAAEQRPNDPFRVASINAPLGRDARDTWHPGYTWAYGLETADGYSVLYSQRYQDFWLRVIDARLGRSKEIKEYYERWGNRVYLFASRNYLKNPLGIQPAKRWNLPLLALANVRYLISPVKLRDDSLTLLPYGRRAEQAAWVTLPLGERREIAGRGDFPGLPLYVYRSERAFPRAFLVEQTAVFERQFEVLDAMAVAGFDDLRTTAYLTTADAVALGLGTRPLTGTAATDEPAAGEGGEGAGEDGEVGGAGTAGEGGEVSGGDEAGGGAGGEEAPADDAVRVTSYGADELSLRVTAPARSVLIVTNSFSRYWKARIDGEEVSLAPADHTFLGVVVPEGEHDVTLSYSPTYGFLWWQ